MEDQEFAEGDKVTVKGRGRTLVIDWIRGKFASCLFITEGGLERILLPLKDLVRAETDGLGSGTTRADANESDQDSFS